MVLSSQQSLSTALAAATAAKISWETHREDDCSHLDGFGSCEAADRIPKLVSTTKASPDSSTVATDASTSTSTDITQDNPEEESITGMSVVFSASFSFGDDAISPGGDSGPEDSLISDAPIPSTPKTPKACTAGSDGTTTTMSTPMIDRRALTNIPAPPLSPGDAFLSPARARKRLIEQYARRRSSSNVSSLSVPSLLILQNSSNLSIPNIGVKSSARRVSAPDIVLRHEAKLDGTVSPEHGTRRSLLVQRQIEILEKRCSLSKPSSQLPTKIPRFSGTKKTLESEEQTKVPSKIASTGKSESQEQTHTCKEDAIVPLLDLDSQVDSQSAGSQEGDGATADQKNASLAQAREAIEASTSVKTKNNGARSKRNILMFLSILFIAAVLSILHPETPSTVKPNITHFVGVSKAAESVRIVSQTDEDERTMEEGVDDDWIVDKARRKSLMSNCWL
jgi:hypothetical protein